MRALLVAERPTRPGVSTTAMPPLGLLSVAASLEAAGIACDVLDRNVDRRPVEPEGYDVVGFSVNLANAGRTLEAIGRLRAARRRPRIVAGGPLCLTHAPLLVGAGADAAVIGEGEDTLPEYLAAGDPGRVPGLCLVLDGEVVTTPPRPWANDLDRLPVPALGKVDLRRYRSPLRRDLPISSVLTSRGCPHDCIFCFHAMGRQFRPRSPAGVVDEIEWQVRELGVREICIEDDNFTLDIARAAAICDLIARRSLRVSLQLRAGVRADRLTEDLCHRLRRAGVWLVALSPETGDDEGLRRINKGFSMEDIRQAATWCRRSGLAVLGCFMVGFPWEGRRQVQATIRTALELDSDFLQVTRVRAFPGTALHRMVEFPQGHDGAVDFPGFFQGGLCHRTPLTEGDMRRLVREFYRRFYLRPRALRRLLRWLPLQGLWDLGRYALATGNA